MGNQKKVAANRLPWYAKIAGILVPLVELVIADRLQKAGKLNEETLSALGLIILSYFLYSVSFSLDITKINKVFIIHLLKNIVIWVTWAGALLVNLIAVISNISKAFSQDHSFIASFILSLGTSLLIISLFFKLKKGFRNWYSFVVYMGFPVIILILCAIFKDQAYYFGMISSVAVAVILFITLFVAWLHNAPDNGSVDSAASSDKTLLARWSSGPKSTLYGGNKEPTSIDISGTIEAWYSDYNVSEREAKEEAERLLNSYARSLRKKYPTCKEIKNNVTILLKKT